MIGFRDLDDIAEEFISEKISSSRNPDTSQVGDLFLEDLVKVHLVFWFQVSFSNQHFKTSSP